jgi:activator of the mannose operon (transcriptional antiterminator)
MNEEDGVKLKPRQIKALLSMLDSKYPVSSTKIALKTRISKNTLKHDLNAIAEYLSSKMLRLVRKPRIGIYVEGETAVKNRLIEELNQVINKEEFHYNKKAFLIKLFLTSNKIPTIEDLCEILSISRPTAVKYVKSVKKWLETRGVTLHGKPGVGYKIEGNEESIRNALVEFINQFKEDEIKKLMEILLGKNNSNSIIELFGKINFKRIKSFIDQIELKTDTILTDRDYIDFALKIAVSLKRIEQKHFLIMDARKLFNIMQNPIYKVIYDHAYMLENKHSVKLSPEEVAFLTLSFISSKVQESSMLQTIDKGSEEEYTNYARQIAKMTKEIFGLSIENDSEFVRMLALHLKSTLNKLKYGLKIENPLLPEIKEEYPLSFNIAEKVAIMLSKKIKINIPEEEAGYIALYIAMAVEKLKHERHKRKKVAVVCAMAMGTSSLLFWRLLNEMPDIDVVQVGSYKDVVEGNIDSDVDLIVSTIPLPNLKTPYIVVSPFLNTVERRKIREALGISKHRPSPVLDKELDEDLIFPNIEAKSYKEVINLLGRKLCDKGYVKKGFIEAVIKREKKFPTGLNTIIPMALPHTGAEYTVKQGFAIAILKNPVQFAEMANAKNKVPVRIVIIPVLTTQNEENIMFYELLQKCRNPQTAGKLLTAKTAKEIKKILRTE